VTAFKKALLTSLKTLDLSAMPITCEVLAAIAGNRSLRALESLSLAKCSQLDEQTFTILLQERNTELRALKKLSIKECSFSLR
jgi:hypothetical protein